MPVPSHVIGGLELSVLPIDLPCWEKGWRLNQLPVVNDFISHDYVMKPVQKPTKYRVWRASRLVRMWRFGDSGTLVEGMEALCHLPIPRCMPPFHLAAPELHPFLKNK